MRHGPAPIIENEPAYERAIEARIKANKRKGSRARWLAQHEDGQRLIDWLEGAGEFAPHRENDPRCTPRDDCDYVDHWEGGAPRYEQCKCRMVSSRVGKLAKSPFLIKMRDQLEEWGSLSDKQTQAVRDSLSRAEGNIIKWDQERAEKLEADRNASQHVGTVGERRDFDLSVERVFSFESQFGPVYISICRDADQNVVVYKGSKPFERGAQINVKATIKAHDQRDGVNQTLISRPVQINQ